MDTKITPKDLNGIDYMNSTASITKHAKTLNFTLNGQELKGSLAKTGSTFSQYDELLFIQGIKEQIYNFHYERFIYTGLPRTLDHYRLESKLVEYGSVVIVKYGTDMYVAANYSILTINMYGEPVRVKVMEPKSSIINGREFDVTKDNAVIMRNSVSRMSPLILLWRYIRTLEKILFQIEKNLVASAPKGIINLKNKKIVFNEDQQAAVKQGMEQLINSQDTFFVLKNVSAKEFDSTGENEEPIYIPIELTDRAESLIKQFTFIKEQIKEQIGLMLNIHQKKERVLESEITQQQGFSAAQKQHALNIRKIDIEKVNEKFGLAITIENSDDEFDNPEDEEDEE